MNNSTLLFRKHFWLSTAIFITLLQQASGQFSLVTQHTSDQTNWNRSNGVASDGLGNTFLVGEFENSLTLGSITLTTVPSQPGSYMLTGFVGKFNSVANDWLWVRKIALISGGNQNYMRSIVMSVALDNAGNSYITGSYAGIVQFGSISLTSTKQGSLYTNDIFVAKLDPDGNFLWAKSFGSKAGGDHGGAITLDGSNNILVTGGFANKIVNCSYGSVEQRDIYILKLNNAGSTIWSKRYASSTVPCNGNNGGNNIFTDAAGNVYLAGYFLGTVSFGNGPSLSITSLNGTQDAFVAKLSGSGTTQWVRSTGSATSRDQGNTVFANTAGEVFTAGEVSSLAFIKKYNGNGVELWSVNPFPSSANFTSSTILGIVPNDQGLVVGDLKVGLKTISAADGSVIASDSLIGNGYNNTPNMTGNFSLFDLEVAGSGYIFTFMARCGSVEVGDLVLTASCTNTCGSCFNFGDIGIVINTGTLPAFQAPHMPEVDTYEEKDVEDISIYPNPASDILNIVIPKRDIEQTIIIQNHLGQVVWSEKVAPQQRNIQVALNRNSFTDGMYYLNCFTDSEMTTEHFVIDK